MCPGTSIYLCADADKSGTLEIEELQKLSKKELALRRRRKI